MADTEKTAERSAFDRDLEKLLAALEKEYRSAVSKIARIHIPPTGEGPANLIGELPESVKKELTRLTEIYRKRVTRLLQNRMRENRKIQLEEKLKAQKDFIRQGNEDFRNYIEELKGSYTREQELSPEFRAFLDKKCSEFLRESTLALKIAADSREDVSAERIAEMIGRTERLVSEAAKVYSEQFNASSWKRQTYGMEGASNSFKSLEQAVSNALVRENYRLDGRLAEAHPDILGIRISLTHFTSKGVPRKEDICDRLAGDYPADFKFEGWHPNCRCKARPIYSAFKLTKEQRRQAKKQGIAITWKKEIPIPENYKKFMGSREGRQAATDLSNRFYQNYLEFKDRMQLISEMTPAEKNTATVDFLFKEGIFRINGIEDLKIDKSLPTDAKRNYIMAASKSMDGKHGILYLPDREVEELGGLNPYRDFFRVMDKRFNFREGLKGASEAFTEGESRFFYTVMHELTHLEQVAEHEVEKYGVQSKVYDFDYNRGLELNAGKAVSTDFMEYMTTWGSMRKVKLLDAVTGNNPISRYNPYELASLGEKEERIWLEKMDVIHQVLGEIDYNLRARLEAIPTGLSRDFMIDEFESLIRDADMFVDPAKRMELRDYMYYNVFQKRGLKNFLKKNLKPEYVPDSWLDAQKLENKRKRLAEIYEEQLLSNQNNTNIDHALQNGKEYEQIVERTSTSTGQEVGSVSGERRSAVEGFERGNDGGLQNQNPTESGGTQGVAQTDGRKILAVDPRDGKLSDALAQSIGNKEIQTLYGQITGVDNAQGKEFIEFLKEKGLWTEYPTGLRYVSSGTQSLVFEKGDKVVKVSLFSAFENNLAGWLESVLLFNDTFLDTHVIFKGISVDPKGDIVAISEQEKVDVFREATLVEIDQFMQEKGFMKDPYQPGKYYNKQKEFYDLMSGNVVVDSEGEIRVLDTEGYLNESLTLGEYIDQYSKTLYSQHIINDDILQDGRYQQQNRGTTGKTDFGKIQETNREYEALATSSQSKEGSRTGSAFGNLGEAYRIARGIGEDAKNNGGKKEIKESQIKNSAPSGPNAISTYENLPLATPRDIALPAVVHPKAFEIIRKANYTDALSLSPYNQRLVGQILEHPNFSKTGLGEAGLVRLISNGGASGGNILPPNTPTSQFNSSLKSGYPLTGKLTHLLRSLKEGALFTGLILSAEIVNQIDEEEGDWENKPLIDPASWQSGKIPADVAGMADELYRTTKMPMDWLRGIYKGLEYQVKSWGGDERSTRKLEKFDENLAQLVTDIKHLFTDRRYRKMVSDHYFQTILGGGVATDQLDKQQTNYELGRVITHMFLFSTQPEDIHRLVQTAKLPVSLQTEIVDTAKTDIEPIKKELEIKKREETMKNIYTPSQILIPDIELTKKDGKYSYDTQKYNKFVKRAEEFYEKSDYKSLNKPLIVKINGKTYKTNSITTIFGRDKKGSKVGDFDDVYVLTEDDIQTVLAHAGQILKTGKWYSNTIEARKNSNSGHLDYKHTLYDILPELEGRKSRLIEIDGTLYNPNEAGNYLWGMALRYYGVLLPSNLAAQLVTIQRYHRFDEPAEQKAIMAGRAKAKTLKR